MANYSDATAKSSLFGTRAKNATRKQVAASSKFSSLLGHLIPRRNRAAFYDWYAYLRWIDDIVDSAPPADVTASAILSRHRRIAREMPGVDQLNACGHEAILQRILSNGCRGSGPNLNNSIADMLDCIDYDAQRRGRIEPYSQLQAYWDREVRSYLGAIATCCNEVAEHLVGLTAAQGAKIVHIVRDLDDDIRDGQFNLSAELAGQYGISPDQLMPVPLDGASAHCVASLLRQADSLLEAGRQELAVAAVSWRYRLIVHLLISKYQCISRSLQRSGLNGAKIKPLDIAGQLVRNLLRPRTGQFPVQTALSPAITLPFVTKLGLMAQLLPGASQSDIAKFNDVCRGLALTDRRRTRRRFQVACLMGRQAFRALAPNAERDPGLSSAAGLVYGFWAIAAIELDRVMDETVIDADAAHRAASGWLAQQEAILTRRSCPDSSRAQIAEAGAIFSALATSFMDCLKRFLRLADAYVAPDAAGVARQQFQEATASLMSGQLRSLVQASPDASPDWHWYRTEILNSKNVQFLLAPMSLWRIGPDSDARFAELVQGFEALNSYYLHYQLLDDVADLAEDTHQGIVGAPGAILLSQACFALRVLDLNENAASLAAAAWETGLISDQLAAAPLYDRLRAYLGASACSGDDESAAEARIRCVLLNWPDELSMSLPELAARRILEGDMYRASLNEREAPQAVEWVLRSGAADRLINSSGHPAHRNSVRRLLASQTDHRLGTFLFVLEGLMRHTLAAARRTVGGRTV